MSNRMRAWSVARLGDPSEAMELTETGIPTPGPRQVLVRVLASAANFPDVLMCRGEYQIKPELPFTPGSELCGEVVSTGADVTSLEVGQRVLGLCSLPYGGFAEYALMDEHTTYAAPASLDDAQSAAMFIGYQTGWFGLHRRARIQPGETLLVHAAAGGVGSAAVQLGKAAGARVIGVVGGEAKVDYAERLGADVVVDRHRDDFVDVVKEVTGGAGADVVYDPVGGDSYERSTKCIAFEGRIIVVGFAGGTIQKVALNHALVKNYSILGLHWGLYNSKDHAAAATCQAELTRLADEGAVAPFVSERFPLEDAAAALQRLADGRTVGRLVLDRSA